MATAIEIPFTMLEAEVAPREESRSPAESFGKEVIGDDREELDGKQDQRRSSNIDPDVGVELKEEAPSVDLAGGSLSKQAKEEKPTNGLSDEDSTPEIKVDEVETPGGIGRRSQSMMNIEQSIEVGNIVDAAKSDEEDEEEGGESEEEEAELAYEAQRLETIRKNNALLASLGLGTINNPVEASSSAPAKPSPIRPTQKRQYKAKSVFDEPRRSSRVAALQEEKTAAGPSFESLPADWRDDKIGKMRGVVLPKGAKISVPSIRHFTDEADERPFKRRKVVPGAPLGDGELAEVEPDDYTIVYPRPTRMSDGTGRLIFGGRWKGVFEPNVTPEEMFVGGAFGGTFYANNYSQVLHKDLIGETDIQELPPSMRRASSSSSNPYSPSTHLTSSIKDPAINRFGKNAGQTLQEWEKSGWIWEGDPRGWAQWYVRFWQGRRCPDDERQVHRWLNLAGPNGRFSRMLLKKIANSPGSGGLSASNSAIEDEEVGTVMRQVCWQWGYQVNEAEWKRKVAGGDVRT